MARKKLYALVLIKHVEGKALAEHVAASLELVGRVQMLPVARSDERCPKGADHGHASYDGAKFCPSCGQYLMVTIDKSTGRGFR